MYVLFMFIHAIYEKLFSVWLPAKVGKIKHMQNVYFAKMHMNLCLVFLTTCVSHFYSITHIVWPVK